MEISAFFLCVNRILFYHSSAVQGVAWCGFGSSGTWEPKRLCAALSLSLSLSPLTANSTEQ